MVEELKMECQSQEIELISGIVKRVKALKLGLEPLSVHMDLTATHLNGTPLRLQELLYAKEGDLAHDVIGIHNNLDRRTGKLMNCFSPRYAAR